MAAFADRRFAFARANSLRAAIREWSSAARAKRRLRVIGHALFSRVLRGFMSRLLRGWHKRATVTRRGVALLQSLVVAHGGGGVGVGVGSGGGGGSGGFGGSGKNSTSGTSDGGVTFSSQPHPEGWPSGYHRRHRRRAAFVAFVAWRDASFADRDGRRAAQLSAALTQRAVVRHANGGGKRLVHSHSHIPHTPHHITRLINSPAFFIAHHHHNTRVYHLSEAPLQPREQKIKNNKNK